MKEIKTVGIIGFNVMGAAIGLNIAASGHRVIYKELNDELVQSMYDKWVVKALNGRVAKGKMTQDEMDRISALIQGTSRYDDLKACDLVIEAAVENQEVKKQIFADLSSACSPDAILVSNTSTFLIQGLMEGVENQSRTAGLHYFFPANVNRLVEVIRQQATGDDTYQALMAFTKTCGKVAISVKDFPGFAINPVFISNYMVLNSFLGDQYNVATLESISKEALNIKYGIMWVQNGSGLGTAYHAAVSMFEYLHDSDIGYPPVPPQIKEHLDEGAAFDLEDGPVLEDPQLRKVVKDRLLGNVFTISTHLIEKEVVSVKDLELGIRTALAWPQGPFAMMNELGMAEAARLVNLSVSAGDFAMPKTFQAGVPAAWKI